MGVFKKMDGNALCALLHKNFEVDNPNRAAVAMQVIERGRDTDDPLAWLACAFASSHQYVIPPSSAVHIISSSCSSVMLNVFFIVISIIPYLNYRAARALDCVLAAFSNCC